MKISHTPGLGNIPSFDDLKQKMQSAITKLQSTDPALAKKLNTINQEVTTLTKGGVSTQDALKQAEKDTGGLTSTEATELQSALGLGANSVNSTTRTGTTDSLAALMNLLSNQTSGSPAEVAKSTTNGLLGQMLASKYSSAATTNSTLSSLGADGISA